MAHDDKGQGSKEFILNEYQHHLKEFERSEEIGEHRVNFFITLVTAVFGALGIASIENGEFNIESIQNILIYILSLMFLLIFGIFTLVRIVHRNLVSHEELRAAGRIRRYFVDKDPEIARYLYYEPYDDKPFRKKEWKDIASIGTGGLVETVMLINSFIAAILAGITLINYFNLRLDFAGGIYDILFDGSSQFISAFIVPLLIVLASIISWYFHPIPNLVVGIAGFLFAWTSQFIFVKLRYDKGRPEKSKIKYPSDIKGGSK